ncbi:conserved exported hypothetical protein [Flavobacterium sp. 9R]|uniref:hypothetical protein n=1 Tax=Flavobacterium sp. 9R TaxID=2653143 RepID=UPI0012F1B731|nr:hypothetical protein [Flavobacterium sp. 9R]VXB12599.1 conserved exported hypothetical protein [Flavobacterium sp. 9R]
MKTTILSILLLLLLSSYKTYTVVEDKNQNQLIALECKEPLFEKELYHKIIIRSTTFSESFTVEIDGTSVSTKNLYKRQGLQLLSKKESLVAYKEIIGKTFSINERKLLTQLD